MELQYIGFFGLLILIGVVAVFGGLKESRDQKRSWQNQLMEAHNEMVKEVAANIQNIISVHPKLSQDAVVTGTNTKKPSDFGRIYDDEHDFTFPIFTATGEAFNEYGSNHIVPLTNAQLTVTGAVHDYSVQLNHSLHSLHYSSATNQIVETLPESKKRR